MALEPNFRQILLHPLQIQFLIETLECNPTKSHPFPFTDYPLNFSFKESFEFAYEPKQIARMTGFPNLLIRPRTFSFLSPRNYGRIRKLILNGKWTLACAPIQEPQLWQDIHRILDSERFKLTDLYMTNVEFPTSELRNLVVPKNPVYVHRSLGRAVPFKYTIEKI